MIRQIALIVLGSAWAGVALAEMPQELVEMLLGGGPKRPRAKLRCGFERDTGSQQITVAGVVKLSSAPQRIERALRGRPPIRRLASCTLPARSTPASRRSLSIYK